MRELSIAVVIAAAVIGLSNRYTVSGSTNLAAFVVDGLTGQTWLCGVSGCRKLEWKLD